MGKWAMVRSGSGSKEVEKGAHHRPFSWRRAAGGHSCRVALIFVFGLKGGSKGNDGSIPLGYSTVVYDDQYTYFLSETETWEPCIKRVRNDLRGKPEILYEAEEIEGDGWSHVSHGLHVPLER